MEEFWNALESADTTGDDMFSSTPAPISEDVAYDEENDATTSVPKELVPIDPKKLFAASTLKGIGQWDETITFDSENIGTAPSSAQLMLDQANKNSTDDELGRDDVDPEASQWDGPQPTGKGVGDLMETIGAPSSFSQLFAEMQEAVIGISSDLVGTNPERRSLTDILTHGNRLRGLGALFIIIALVGIALDSLAETSKTSSILEQLAGTLK